MPRFSIKKATGFLKGLARTGIKLLTKAQNVFNQQVVSGNYNLRERIQDSDFHAAPRPSRAAFNWWVKWRKENAKKYKHKGLMEAGKLYNFKYPNPKHRDILDYWDVNPLVLCLGHYKSKAGVTITQGINLHLLPEKVRREVLIKVFDMFRQKYRGQMYRSTQRKVDSVSWKVIADPLRQYGAAFAFRSYIPARQQYSFVIPYEEWEKAVFVPSEKYHGIAFTKLKGMWKDYIVSQMHKLTPDRLEKALTDRYI